MGQNYRKFHPLKKYFSNDTIAIKIIYRDIKIWRLKAEKVKKKNKKKQCIILEI